MLCREHKCWIYFSFLCTHKREEDEEKEEHEENFNLMFLTNLAICQVPISDEAQEVNKYFILIAAKSMGTNLKWNVDDFRLGQSQPGVAQSI